MTRPNPIRAADPDPTATALEHAVTEVQAVVDELRQARVRPGSTDGTITIPKLWAGAFVGLIVTLASAATLTIYDNRTEIRILRLELENNQTAGLQILGNLVTQQELDRMARQIQEGRPNTGAIERFRQVEERVTRLEQR